jgi:hypothetical protein
MVPSLRSFLLGLSLVALVACGDDGGPGNDVSFSAEIQPIFTANCALSGCHTGTSPAAGQNLSAGQAYSNIVNVASTTLPSMDRVEPGQPDQSFLVHKIQGTQGPLGSNMGARMPLNANPLSQTQIDLIRSWITQGALNN